MRKTLFAGLTVLDEDESVTEDGGSFIGQDRDTIDRYLELGAKTHRHNNAAPLPDPIGAASATVVASAGHIPSDATYNFGYTLEDSSEGETILSPTVTVATGPPLDPPTVAPLASADYAGGNLLTDTYYYAISYIDGEGGETPLGPSVFVEREPGFPLGQVLLSGLTNGMATASAAGWRLYRTVGGGGWGYLASGFTDTYTDNGTVAIKPDLTPIPDDINVTNNVNTIMVDLPPDGPGFGQATGINLYVSEDGDFTGDTFLDQFPIASAGHRMIYRDISPEDGQPPDVSTSVGGASLIDPDTELLDWHWKRPVAASGLLGSGALGDVKLVTGTGTIYGMLHASGAFNEWTVLGSAGGGGSGSQGPQGPAGPPGSAGSGGTIRSVEEQGGRHVVWAPSALAFAASGSASVGVSDLGGGSALVTIFSKASGVAGPAGPQGPQGASGAQGIQGPQGDPGATGATGPQGSTGSPGSAGSGGTIRSVEEQSGIHVQWAPSALVFAASGSASVGVSDLGGGSALVTIFSKASGVAGPAGPQGPQGASGASGAQGIQGPPGNDGATGATGATGAAGPPGSAGSGGTVRSVQEPGQHVVWAPSALVFAGSGSAGVGVEDIGGGSARITFSAPTIYPGSAGSGGTVRAVQDATSTVWAPSAIKFTGSGSAGVRVSNPGGGSAAVEIGLPAALLQGLAGPLNARPAAAASNRGYTYMCTDTQRTYVSDGSQWIKILGEEAGTIQNFGGVATPSAWLVCDGATYPRTSYPELLTALTLSKTGNTNATTAITGISNSFDVPVGALVEGPGVAAGSRVASYFGSQVVILTRATTTTQNGGTFTFYPWGNGDGSSTFNVPDLRGRSLLGPDAIPGQAGVGNIAPAFAGVLNVTASAGVGQRSGEEVHVLLTAELPSHTHGAGSYAAASHTHGAGTLTNANANAHNHTMNQAANTTVTGAGTRANDVAGGGGAQTTDTVAAHTHNITGSTGASAPSVTGTSGSTGSDTAHQNLPPYGVALPIIKV